MRHFDLFSQNNSGGTYKWEPWRGVTDYVLVEYKVFHNPYCTWDELKNRAEDIGLYFNGVEEGLDCECCGDRWYMPDEGNLATPYTYVNNKNYDSSGDTIAIDGRMPWPEDEGECGWRLMRFPASTPTEREESRAKFGILTGKDLYSSENMFAHEIYCIHYLNGSMEWGVFDGALQRAIARNEHPRVLRLI